MYFWEIKNACLYACLYLISTVDIHISVCTVINRIISLLLFIVLRLFADKVPVLSAEQFVLVDLCEALFLCHYAQTQTETE